MAGVWSRPPPGAPPVWRLTACCRPGLTSAAWGVAVGVPAYREQNNASLHLGEYESFKKATLDPYVAMRSAYYESRAEAVDKTKAKKSAQKVALIPFARGDD